MSAFTKGMGMIRRTAVLALLLLPLAFLATTGAHAAARKTPDGKVTRASGRCGSCHPDERVAFEKSRHAGEEMHCTSCHGGNDQTVDEAAAHGGPGWRGKITRADDPKVCASCHSDESKMQPYDLPVDQYDLYQTSGHGKGLAKGGVKRAGIGSGRGEQLGQVRSQGGFVLCNRGQTFALRGRVEVEQSIKFAGLAMPACAFIRAGRRHVPARGRGMPWPWSSRA